MRQRRQRAKDRVCACPAAKIALNRPQGRQDGRIDSVLAGNFLENIAVFSHFALRRVDALQRNHPVAIVRVGQFVFRLPVLEIDNFRQGTKAVKGCLQRLAGYPLIRGLAAEVGEPGGKILFR